MKWDESLTRRSKPDLEQVMLSSLRTQSLESLCSFVAVSILVQRMLLEIYGTEGIMVLIICVGINGLLMISKPAKSTADVVAFEFLLLLFVTTTRRIFVSKIVRESELY